MTAIKRSSVFISALTLFGVSMAACDLNHQERCEWYLMPNPDPEWIEKVDPGYIPVCARNLVINRENCDLQATLEFAETHYGKKMRYIDIEIDKTSRFPRKVTGLTECHGEGEIPFWKKWQRAFDDWYNAMFLSSSK